MQYNYDEYQYVNIAECEANTLFDRSLGVLIGTQCCFILSILIYKQQGLKRLNRCVDCWSIFIYTQIAICLIHVLSVWFYTGSLVVTTVIQQYWIKYEYDDFSQY